MKVVVVTPEEHMGDVVGDLNRRRGIILGMEDITSGKEVSSEVPLAKGTSDETSLPEVISSIPNIIPLLLFKSPTTSPMCSSGVTTTTFIIGLL